MADITDEVIKEQRAAREALSEARLRAIIREELAAWEKRQQQRLRFGVPMNMETK